MDERRLIFSLRQSPQFVRWDDAAGRAPSTLPDDTIALSFELSPADDETIQSLPPLPSLRCLDLDGTRITDRSLAKIAALPALEELWLEQTAVTDEGLRPLHSASRLRFISLAYAGVSSVGVDALRVALPGLEVNE